MPSSNIKINRDIDLTFKKVLDKFKSDMKIKTIQDQKPVEVKIKTRGVIGEVVEVKQSLSVDFTQRTITIDNMTTKTKSTSVFRFCEEGNTTVLSYSEFPSGTKSKVRSLNYLVFELPILNRSTKKKIRLKLEYIKKMVEQGHDNI